MRLSTLVKKQLQLDFSNEDFRFFVFCVAVCGDVFPLRGRETCQPQRRFPATEEEGKWTIKACHIFFSNPRPKENDLPEGFTWGQQRSIGGFHNRCRGKTSVRSNGCKGRFPPPWVDYGNSSTRGRESLTDTPWFLQYGRNHSWPSGSGDGFHVFTISQQQLISPIPHDPPDSGWLQTGCWAASPLQSDIQKLRSHQLEQFPEPAIITRLSVGLRVPLRAL